MLVLIHPFPLICWDSILNRHNWKLEDRDTLCVNHVVGVQSISCVWLFETPWTVAHQALLSSTISQSFLRIISIQSVMLSNRLKLCHPLLLLPSIFPSIRVFFQWVDSSHQVAKVLELHLRLHHQSFQWIFKVDFLQDWLIWSPCCPRDSQESPPAPLFKSINSLVLSLRYDPTLISIHDYWKKQHWL